MASAGLLALIDDISTLLDDVSLLTKVAAKKTAGVLGDDLALNAEQVSGVKAERELPVVWAVAKGSTKNKLVLVPLALLLSAFIPWVITPLLMLGGLYLCFEGFEKLAHKFLPNNNDTEEKQKLLDGLADPGFDLLAFEEQKIKGAIRTDFILSAEIVVIALGTVQSAPFMQQVVTVSLIAAAITVGVYGLVAGIVKLDDAGLHLLNSQTPENGRWRTALGSGILSFCPHLMRTLSVVGTAAMFLVGGGILIHGIHAAHGVLEAFVHLAEAVSIPEALASIVFNGLAGILAGGVAVLVYTPLARLFGRGAH